MGGSYLSLGYPYVQIFSVVLSGALMLGLGEQSLVIGSLTLLVGLVFHSVYEHIVKALPRGGSTEYGQSRQGGGSP